MGRRMTLDEFLKAFTDEETESVPDAISVRVTDAEVHSLGVLFIQLMGGLAQCLRRPPKDVGDVDALHVRKSADLLTRY